MSVFRKPVFLNSASYHAHMKALDRRKPPPTGHYPVGYALSSEGAKRALRRRFPDSTNLQEPGEPQEHDDAFVFDIPTPR